MRMDIAARRDAIQKFEQRLGLEAEKACKPPANQTTTFFILLLVSSSTCPCIMTCTSVAMGIV